MSFLFKFFTKPFFVSAIIFLVTIIVMVLLSIPIIDSFEKEQHNRTFRAATNKATKISFELNSRINLNKATASFIEQNPNLDQKSFSNYVNSILQYDNGVISSMAYGKDLIVTLIAPFDFNKKALGLDLSIDSTRHEGLKRAIAHKKVFLEGPFELIQDNIGLCSYIPIYATDSITLERVALGVTDVIMLWDKFLEVIGLSNNDDIIEYAIRGKNGEGERGAVFYGDSTLFHRKGVVKISIPLPLGEWVIAAYSRENWMKEVIPFAIIILVSLTLLFSILIYVILKIGRKYIKKSELRYRYITERSRDVLWTFNPHTLRFTYCSQSVQHNFGFTPEEFCNMSLNELLTPESYTLIISELQTSIDKLQKGIILSTENSFEIQHLHKTGVPIWIEISVNAIINSDGKIQEIIGSTRLINDRKKLESDLIRSNSTKNKFFSIIAHDLKNPIFSLLQISEEINNNFNNRKMDFLEEDIAMLRDTTKNTFSLLEHLLEWSRSQMNAITYNPIASLISDIITECIYHLSAQAIAKKITIKYHSLKDYFVWCDKKMIQTVIRNLVSNAIKYSNSDTTIEICVMDHIEDLNYIQVAVVDAGTGMSAADMEKLFKIDEKIVSSRGTNDETGTGLGLILCKEFINKHNCKIWVESELGKGTTFYFTLPKHKETT